MTDYIDVHGDKPVGPPQKAFIVVNRPSTQLKAIFPTQTVRAKRDVLAEYEAKFSRYLDTAMANFKLQVGVTRLKRVVLQRLALQTAPKPRKEIGRERK